jgi:hypothetical protein
VNLFDPPRGLEGSLTDAAGTGNRARG